MKEKACLSQHLKTVDKVWWWKSKLLTCELTLVWEAEDYNMGLNKKLISKGFWLTAHLESWNEASMQGSLPTSGKGLGWMGWAKVEGEAS